MPTFGEMEWFGNLVRASRYAISEHALRSIVSRRVSVRALETVLLHGRILEEHQNPMRPTCYLFHGEVEDKAVHVVCAKDPNDRLVVLFAYIPELPVWSSPTRRRARGEDQMTKSVGSCFFCGGNLVEITVGKYPYRYEGQMFVVKRLPATLCQQCGEKYVGAKVGERLNQLIDEQRFLGSEEAKVLDYESAIHAS